MGYYQAQPGMTVRDFVQKWMEGEKAYDDSFPLLMDVEDLWRYRDYTRSPKFVKAGYSWPYHSDEGKLERSSKEFKGGSDKWDTMALSMEKYGWQDDEPLHLNVGKDGKAKVGEGNHRLAIWRQMGKKQAPVMVHFVTEVIETVPGMSRPPQVAEGFRAWLSLQERTLYHGTIVDYESSIRKYGLQGGWHEPEDTFVGDMYDGEYGDIERSEDDDVVFMADKDSLDKAITAMQYQVGKKLNKWLGDVTPTDIRNHGLLVVIKDVEDVDQYDPDDIRWMNGAPRGVEPGDYFAPSMGGDLFLRGSALIRYLQRHGQLETEKSSRDKYARAAIAKGHFPNIARHVAQDAPMSVIDRKMEKMR